VDGRSPHLEKDDIATPYLLFPPYVQSTPAIRPSQHYSKSFSRFLSFLSIDSRFFSNMAGSHAPPDLPKDSVPPPIEPPSPTAQRRLDALLNTIQPPTSRYGRPVPECWVPMQDRPLHHPRKLRVVTIGAAISAMNMAYEIQYGYDKLGTTEEGTRGVLEDIVEHCIYESNAEIGGTWLVNRYPGVACDVPAHIYTCKFACLCSNPNSDGLG
jgi:hypothetical protein